MAPVTVISRAQIEQGQYSSLQEVLRQQQGLIVANNGGPGKLTSVFMRGANSSHVLVLLDGAPIADASGAIAFQDIPVDMVERIEIVRGPRSSLYGSSAIGGVIQIFSRRGAAAPSLALGVGSRNERRIAANLGGQFAAAGWYNIGLSSLSSDGYNACLGRSPFSCGVIEPDRDGYDNRSMRLAAGWRLDDGGAIAARLLQIDGDAQFDGGFANESQSDLQLAQVDYRFKLSDAWRSEVSLSRYDNDVDRLLRGRFASRFNSSRNSVAWRHDIALNDGQSQLQFGLDQQLDRLDSNTAYTRTSRRNKAIYGQLFTAFGADSIELSLRRDDNEQFGGINTGGLAWARQLASSLRLTASAATAFRGPSFVDLYYPGFSNPNLRPERSRNLELGLAGGGGEQRWRLALFENRVSNLIGLDASFTPVNINRARIRGVEGEWAQRLGQWRTQIKVDLLQPLDRSGGANDGKLLARRARHTAVINVDRDVAALSYGFSIRDSGRRYDDAANRSSLGAFSVVDLRAEYRLERDWRLQARVENLLDKDYAMALDYPQAGRGVFFTLRYQPQPRR